MDLAMLGHVFKSCCSLCCMSRLVGCRVSLDEEIQTDARRYVDCKYSLLHL